MLFRGLLYALLSACCLCLCSSSKAQDYNYKEKPGDESLRWQDNWRRFHPVEYVGTGSMLAGSLFALQLDAPSQARWRGGVLMDDGVRNGLRLQTPSARNTAARISDGLMFGLVAYPLVVDGGMLTLNGNSDTAWQMMMINTQSIAFTSLTVSLVKFLAGRERPYARDCRDGDGYDEDCADMSDHTFSFMSGHTAMAFTGAGLMCAHHTNMPLYGSKQAGIATCATAMSAATATGLLRILADKHYATDVLAGAALGTVSGWLLPVLLHYGFGEDTEDDDNDSYFRASLAPMASQNEIGLSYLGVF